MTAVTSADGRGRGPRRPSPRRISNPIRRRAGAPAAATTRCWPRSSSSCPSSASRPSGSCSSAGIGCAGRFAYYMDTYGMHSIHGRAPAIATGLASVRDDLSIWVVSGDGDALSIGGNHLIHALRRNVPIKILLFNNQIYGLTKGQASPTSALGKVTKSTPFGVSDHPFNPIALAIGAEATFVARTLDRDRHHLTSVLRAAAQHQGAALVEIYQNCPVFNDGAFFAMTEKETRDLNQIRLEPDSRSASASTASVVSRCAPTGDLRSSMSPRSASMHCSFTIRSGRTRALRSRSPICQAIRLDPPRSASSVMSSAPSTDESQGPTAPRPTTSSPSCSLQATPGRSVEAR